MKVKKDSMSAKAKSYPLIPEEEQKCVWMTTGFISYKLCDRNYRCEICPFDQAIKNDEMRESDFQESGDNWAEGSLNAEPAARINRSFFYHPDHCWVKVENSERVRIGIDDLLTQLLTRVKVAILPQEGSFTGQGECFAHMIQEDYILPVISPLSGSVQTVNPRLEKEPGLITDDPRGEGWLITVKPKNLESDIKNLLFGRKALAWYQMEEKEIIARTDLILKHNPQEVGPTMQDGGVRISSLREVLDIVNTQQRTQILDFSVTRQKKLSRLLN
jgi:glycine cleavage system H protein